MGNDASKPTMTLTSLRPKSRKLAKESIGKKEEEKEKEEERKSNGNQDQPKSREDIWEDYFNDDASRMSIINTDRYADSDQDINEINKLENTVEKADLPSSQRSTFAMLTEDSLMLVRSVQKIKFLSEQLYDHYGRGNAPEDEDILDIIKMIDSMPLSDPTPETDIVVMTKPPAHDDNTTVTTDDRVSSGESDDSGKGDFENNEKKNNTTTTAETTTTAPASEVVLHDAINNTQAHEEIGKSLANTIQIMKEMKAKKAAVKKSAKSSKMPAVAETKTVDTNDAIDRSTNIDTVSTQLDLGMSPTNAVSNHSSPIRKGSTDSAPIPTPVIPSITAPIHKPDTLPKQQVPATVPKLPLNISSSALSSYTYPNSGNGSTDGNDKFAPTSSSRKGSGATPRVPSGRLTAQAQSYKANDGSTSLPVPGEIDFSLRSQQVILPRPVSSGSLLSNISQKKTRAQPTDDMYKSHWIVMWCPGKKIPIRGKPDIEAPVTGYVHSGYKIHVAMRTVGGFYELMDGKGYVNKATKGVEWRQSEAPL